MVATLLSEHMKAKLTVFTPTYNRAHTLHMGYEALLRQTCADFVWLIVDDGSSDSTKELVSGWIAENKITIRYYYQENQGIHQAYNTAFQLIDTELFVSVDSDDRLTDNAVEKIISYWEKTGSLQHAGIMGLSQTYHGKTIGTLLPKNQKDITLTDFYYRNGGKGDKTLVYRTELLKELPPYPSWEGEKFFPLSYLYHMIDRHYNMLILNEPLTEKDYHPDGLSTHIYQQYWNNPKGFAFYRIHEMEMAPTFKRQLIVCMHYIASCIRSKDKQWWKNAPCKFPALLALPLGAIFYAFIRYKVKNNQKYQVKY